MQIDLTPAECENILNSNYYAHLGCVDDNKPYVFPITYAYKDGILYGFSMEGHKVDIMRKNPNICIQVEHVENEYAWQSVMCWGEFEEVTDPQGAQDIKLLIADVHGQAMLKDEKLPFTIITESVHKQIDDSVVYRMKPIRMTGKAEKKN